MVTGGWGGGGSGDGGGGSGSGLVAEVGEAANSVGAAGKKASGAGKQSRCRATAIPTAPTRVVSHPNLFKAHAPRSHTRHARDFRLPRPQLPLY